MSIMNRLVTVIALTALLFGCISQKGSAQTTIPRSVIASGAVSTSGGGTTLRGTIGQPITGTAKSVTNAAFFGFWYREGQQTVGVDRVPYAAVGELLIRDIHPNPVRGDATVTISSAAACATRLYVIDILGRVVADHEITLLAPGEQTFVLSLRGVAPGWYLVGIAGSRTTRWRTLIVQ